MRLFYSLLASKFVIISKKNLTMNANIASFIIYIIHKIARLKKISPAQVYKALDKSGCIDEYLVPFYDELHSMDASVVASDALLWLEKRGAKI